MAVVNQNYGFLDDPKLQSNTGYTNIFLTERNNLFPVNQSNGGDYRRVEEKPVSPDKVFCSIKDLEPTEVMRVFFSKHNIDYLQSEIIKQVYERSCGNYKISRQSDDELLIVLRSTFLQYTKNLPFNIEGQVQELNYQALLWIIPRIMTNIQGYIQYAKEQETPNKFLSNPNYVGSKSTRGTFDLSTASII